jgi:TRAP-type C4-dicarboxylate transport system substrate-binding protein
MNYKVTNMCDEYAKQIAQWQYDGEYAEYNTLSYEQMKEKGSGIVNPAKRDNYLCFVDDNDYIEFWLP